MPIKTVTFPTTVPKPTEQRLVEAGELQTILALSKLRLIKAGGIGIGGSTNLAALVAAEADFDGYPAGGITLTAWGDPLQDELLGPVLLVAPSKQFNWAHVADDVENEIVGAFVVDADGNLRGVEEFDEPVTMSNTSSGLVVTFAIKI